MTVFETDFVFQPLKLPVSTSGIPAPQIFWSKDGDAVDFDLSARYITDSDGSLIIPVVVPSDEGI